jgi:hypothetical protein
MTDKYETVRALGCLACAMASTLGYKRANLRTEIHHMTTGGLAGQKQLGDRYVLPLCGWHHRSSWTEVAPPSGWAALQRLDLDAAIYGPGLAQHARKFRETYGTEPQLHAVVVKLLGRVT